jgi:hypothetical protein
MKSNFGKGVVLAISSSIYGIVRVFDFLKQPMLFLDIFMIILLFYSIYLIFFKTYSK